MNPAPPPNPPEDDSAPRGQPRSKRPLWFIAVWLVVQLALPASYYATSRDFDERFAWRMFSPQRMVRCAHRWVEVNNSKREVVEMATDVHMVWWSLVDRQRPSVVAGYSVRRCNQMREQGVAPDVRLEMHCQLPEGREVVHDGSENLCVRDASDLGVGRE